MKKRVQIIPGGGGSSESAAAQETQELEIAPTLGSQEVESAAQCLSKNLSSETTVLNEGTSG